MRAKQSTTQFPPSSLAQTILPSAANDRGRKSRGARAPEPAVTPAAPLPAAVPEPVQAPMEFAGAPAAPDAAAPVWAPPPAQTAAPDWGPTSTSRFGGAPVTDYPTNYPAAPGFPPQPHYAEPATVASTQ